MRQPQPVQRHGDQHIGVIEQFGAGAGHPAAHRRGQFIAVAIFQAMDQQARRPLLEARDGARARENRRIGHGGRREETPAFAGRQIGLERRSQSFAIGALDEAHGAPAFRAEAAMRGDGAAAGEADRRIEQVERRRADPFAAT